MHWEHTFAPQNHARGTEHSRRQLCGARVLADPPQPHSQSVSCNTMATTGEELTALIEAKGQEIRTLKTDGAAKDTLKPHIDELLVLKAKFKSMTGATYVAPGQEKKSKPAASPPAPSAGGAEAVDPNKKSKKQLQREKKEAEKAVAKAKAKEERERKQAEAGAKGAAQEMCVKASYDMYAACTHGHFMPGIWRVLADTDYDVGVMGVFAGCVVSWLLDFPVDAAPICPPGWCF